MYVAKRIQGRVLCNTSAVKKDVIIRLRKGKNIVIPIYHQQQIIVVIDQKKQKRY